jgi:hypothetical protein
MDAAALEIIPHEEGNHGDRQQDGTKDEGHDDFAAATAARVYDFNWHDLRSNGGTHQPKRTASVEVPPTGRTE